MELNVKLILGDIELNSEINRIIVKRISSIISCHDLATAKSLGEMFGEKNVTYLIPSEAEKKYKIFYTGNTTLTPFDNE